MISNEYSICDSNASEEVVNPNGNNAQLGGTNFEKSTSPKNFASGEADSSLKKEDHKIPTEDIPFDNTSNITDLESSVNGLISLALGDEKRISDDFNFKDNVMEDNFVIDSSSCEKDDPLSESDDYAEKENMEGDQSNALDKSFDVESENIGNQVYEDDTSKDMSINEVYENEDEFSHGKEEETGQGDVCDITKTTEGHNSEQNAGESEDESWEYEWEEEEEYEYEYYEEEDDEYKVQKFDGSFSVSLKT